MSNVKKKKKKKTQGICLWEAWNGEGTGSVVKLVIYNLDMTAVDKKNLDQNRAPISQVSCCGQGDKVWLTMILNWLDNNSQRMFINGLMVF